MKVMLICAFDTYFDRVRMLLKYYEMKKCDVMVVTSDFSHRHKERRKYEWVDIHVNVRPYTKNLSVDRLRSHQEFSKKVQTIAELNRPDLIHALVPPNSLVKQLALYKKKHHSTKLIFDVIDLWPETMPVSHIEWLPPIRMWRKQREQYIDRADLIFTECEYYQEVLDKKSDPKVKTLYWARKEKPVPYTQTSRDAIHYCYLGSINNIIDTDCIANVLKETMKYRKTVLHIIGNGEMKDRLLQKAKDTGAEVIDHKELYDPSAKQMVFDQCHYGLNIMKPSVVVGLTMKSLDYLCAGLPLINTIGGDTQALCRQYDIGWNLTDENCAETVKAICRESLDEWQKKRNQAQEVYQMYFTEASFFATLDKAGVCDA